MTAAASTEDRWIRRFQPSPEARTQLVCLPHAGGSATFYFPVASALSPAIDVLAIQYPGRQDRRLEPALTSIGALADSVFAALSGCLDRPLALFGHSMGATVAFEVASRLEAVGVVAAALFVSGRRAPSRHRDETVHQRTDDGIVAELKALSGTEVSLLGDQELVRMILPAIRSDYRAVETYRYQPKPKLACPIFAFVGDSDPRVEVDDVRAWADHTTATFDLRIFPGGHFYLTQYETAIIAEVNAALAPARS